MRILCKLCCFFFPFFLYLFPPFLDSWWFCLWQSWDAGQCLLGRCIIGPNWLNPARRRCGNMNPPLLSPVLLHPWNSFSFAKSSHWNNRKQASQWKQLVNKKNPSLSPPLTPNSQNKPGRKRGMGCVTADRVRATDEWVQEAVMSDILSSDKSVRQKMPQQRQKDTGSQQAWNSQLSNRDNRSSEAAQSSSFTEIVSCDILAFLHFDKTTWR